MGSFSEEPSTLEDAGTQHRRARLGSYGGIGLEKMWYVVCSSMCLQISLFHLPFGRETFKCISKFEAAYKILHL